MIKRLETRLVEFRLSRKAVALFLLAVLLISLIPLVIASFYNRPYLDDYAYGRATAHAWRDTGSIARVLSAAAGVVKDSYRDWQGTYSAIFMFALQPGIFSEQTYYLATFFLLGLLLFSTFYCLHSVIVVALKRDTWTWLAVSAAASLLSIQLLPSAFGSFYWFNGAIYYTFYYTLMLFLLGHLTRVPFVSGDRERIYRAICIAFLAILIAGGNYMTALLTALLLALFCAWFTLKKIRGGWAAYMGLSLLIVGLAVSAMAPGNAVRSAALEAGGIPSLSIVGTLWRTALMPAWYTLKWISPTLVLAFALLTPLLWQEARKAKHAFPYPLLVIVMGYGLYAAQYAPPIMMNVLGSERHLNIFYFSFILIAMGCLYYLFGWFQRKKLLPAAGESGATQKEGKSGSIALAKAAYVLLAMVLVFAVNKTGWSSVSAARSLISGEAQQFAAQRDARLVYYLDPSIRDVVVQPLTAIPGVFYGDDFQDPDMWVNRAVADFYDKSSVSLAE